MVAIPPGHFVMVTSVEDRFANTTERPAQRLVIGRAFEVSRFPITEAQLLAFNGTGAASPLPAVRVSWFDATRYTAWLTEHTGRSFRLLSEAEWEYCCRAGSSTVFATGDDLDPSQANFLYDEHGFKVGLGHRTPARSYAPNAFGLEDMHGNVCEWVADKWRPTYDSSTMDAFRVIRGGAWDYMPRLLRCAWRDFATPDTKRDNLGFRIACDL